MDYKIIEPTRFQMFEFVRVLNAGPSQLGMVQSVMRNDNTYQVLIIGESTTCTRLAKDLEPLPKGTKLEITL
jgi:hypothetical protein